MLDNITNGIETWVMTPAELKAVFTNAERGSVIVYAVGDLNNERLTTKGKRWADVDNTADLAYRLWKAGDAELLQKRHGPNKYEYRIMRL